MHLFVNFDWFSIFQSFGNTHVASLRWICYQQILGASTDGTGSQNLLECSYKPLLSTHIYGDWSVRVTYRVLISLGSISFLVTADCRVSTLGYSLSYVYATCHIFKRLHGSGFVWGTLEGLVRKCCTGESVPIRSCLCLTNPSQYLEMQEGSLCLLLLSKTKQQHQEKSNCLGGKNNAMLLPTQQQNMFSSYLCLKVKEHLQAPWQWDLPHTYLAYVYGAMRDERLDLNVIEYQSCAFDWCLIFKNIT